MFELKEYLESISYKFVNFWDVDGDWFDLEMVYNINTCATSQVHDNFYNIRNFSNIDLVILGKVVGMKEFEVEIRL